MNAQLKELQSKFIKCLVEGDFHELSESFHEQNLEHGIISYIRNYRQAVRGLLSKVYPGIWELLGEECANAAAIAYSKDQSCPGKSATVESLAKNFPQFLGSCESFKHLEYLSDYATFELLWEEAKSFPKLSQIEGLSHHQMHHFLHSSFASAAYYNLFQSNFSILEISKLLAGEVTELSTVSNRTWLLIYKAESGICVKAVDEACYEVLKLLKNGAKVGEAIEYVCEGHNINNPQSFFEWLLSIGRIQSPVDL